MRLEQLDLHGLNLEEAVFKVKKNLTWCINHEVEVLDINHGKGHHSNRNFSVLKSEIRKMLKEDEFISANGYRVVYGESSLPIALTFDDGHTLIVRHDCKDNYLGGRKEIDKNLDIFSKQGRQKRKQARSQKAYKRNRK